MGDGRSLPSCELIDPGARILDMHVLRQMSPSLPDCRVEIALVLPSFAGGGAERVALSLISGVTRQAAVVVFDCQGPLRPLVPKGTRVHDLGRPRLRQAWPALLRWLRSSRPAVVLSTFGYVNLTLLAMRPLLPRGTRIVIREANTPSLALSRGRAPFPTVMRLAYRLLYPTADLVLCQHRAMAEEMCGDFGVSTQRIAVLPNPVDIGRLRTRAPFRERGRGRRFVAAGRLTHQKGFDRLIGEFASLDEDDRLWLFGDGPDRAALCELARERGAAGRVRFAGFQPVPWRYYAGADALLVPSRWEGLPNVALEALACGTPVIATPESGGIAEVAAVAPRGAVTVAPWGDAFRREMLDVVPSAVDETRPSLLPKHHERDRVIERFEALLGLS